MKYCSLHILNLLSESQKRDNMVGFTIHIILCFYGELHHAKTGIAHALNIKD